MDGDALEALGLDILLAAAAVLMAGGWKGPVGRGGRASVAALEGCVGGSGARLCAFSAMKTPLIHLKGEKVAKTREFRPPCSLIGLLQRGLRYLFMFVLCRRALQHGLHEEEEGRWSR